MKHLSTEEEFILKVKEKYKKTSKAGSYRSGIRDDAVSLGRAGENAFRLLLDKAGYQVSGLDDGIRDSGDSGYDMVVNGVKIDVKTRGRNYGYLYVTYDSDSKGTPKPIRADAYCLLEKQDEKYVFIGWVGREQVEKAQIKLGIGGVSFNYSIVDEALSDYWSFLERIEHGDKS